MYKAWTLVPPGCRSLSSSPYGRTHVWKRRLPTLPNPVVPKFPQRVIRADGSSFVHWTTSPRSTVKLTTDTTNNPMWNTGVWTDARAVEEQAMKTGALGRFNKRFELGDRASLDWIDKGESKEGDLEGEIVQAALYERKKTKKKK